MITVKINERTRKGKLLFEILLGLEDKGYCSIERIPNAELIKSLKEAKEGKVITCNSIEDLLKMLDS